MPQCVDRPLGTPEGIRVVVVEFGFAIFIERYLADPRAGSGLIAVFAVHITDDSSSLQGMPKVGIKPLAFFERAPFHCDPAKPLVPVCPRLTDYPIKIPVGQLGI